MDMPGQVCTHILASSPGPSQPFSLPGDEATHILQQWG